MLYPVLSMNLGQAWGRGGGCGGWSGIQKIYVKNQKIHWLFSYLMFSHRVDVVVYGEKKKKQNMTLLEILSCLPLSHHKSLRDLKCQPNRCTHPAYFLRFSKGITFWYNAV